MKKVIKKPLDEMEEALLSLIPILTIHWKNRREKQILFKLYPAEKETSKLTPYEKEVNFCFHLMNSFVANKMGDDTKNINLYRITVDKDNLSIFYSIDKNNQYSEISMTRESIENNIIEWENMSDKEHEDYFLDRLIETLR